MNAISMLRGDHRKIEALMRRFEATGAQAFRQRQAIVRRLCTELEIHSQLEEQLFYPAVDTTGDAKAHAVVRASIGEHHFLRTLVDALNGMSADGQDYEPIVVKLAARVRHHIAAEERDLLPGVQAQLGRDTLAYLGDQMARRRREITPSHASDLFDDLRQAKGFLAKAYDALTGAEPASAPLRQRPKVTPKRRVSLRQHDAEAGGEVRRTVTKTKVRHLETAGPQTSGSDRLRDKGSRSDSLSPRQDRMSRTRR